MTPESVEHSIYLWALDFVGFLLSVLVILYVALEKMFSNGCKCGVFSPSHYLCLCPLLFVLDLLSGLPGVLTVYNMKLLHCFTVMIKVLRYVDVFLLM